MHDGPHHLPHAHPHPHPHGHNRAGAAVQWQTPHRPDSAAVSPAAEPDVDLVETSFVEGFARCTDPASFLRLAGIAHAGRTDAGALLRLLRVEIEDVTDVGSATPLLGGGGLRYDPLPEPMVSRRRRLRFAYLADGDVVLLDFAAARALAPDPLA